MLIIIIIKQVDLTRIAMALLSLLRLKMETLVQSMAINLVANELFDDVIPNWLCFITRQF